MKKNKKSALVTTIFAYTDPLATAVFVAGSFNDWKPDVHVLTQTALGNWQIELPLAPGRYEYLFVVDGNWTPDPLARESVPNPHGGFNSVVQV